MSRISVRVVVQWDFQLGQVWLGIEQHFHLHQANVMFLYARACLVHVVIMVLSEIGTLASAEKTWLLLFPYVDSEGEARVNAGMEFGHVVI